MNPDGDLMENTTASYKNLFLRQSYLDNWTEYEKSLAREDYTQWDYLLLTASNYDQAEAYQQQLSCRITAGKLPAGTRYAVLPDPEGKRVGSGGATFGALRYIREHEKGFEELKILCIHSGGDSKRVPQYSACGKLFSPVPRQLPDGRRSTLFDEFIITMTAVPARMGDGMLVCSGDVLLLFNPLQIDFHARGAAVLSIKEPAQTGQHHGVFTRDGEGNVGRFLHKQTIETLTSLDAVNARGMVDIDTGAVILCSHILSDLYALVDTQEKYASFVNEQAGVSLYADFLYPLASQSTLDAFYLEKPEGSFTEELKHCRTSLWETLRPYRMKMISFSPASFIHFGTTSELLDLMTRQMEGYRYLDWSGQVNTNSGSASFAASNSYISRDAMVEEGSYIEDSNILPGTKVGKGCVISGVTLRNATLPDGMVLHGLKLKDGCFVARKYGVRDNPKEKLWLGRELDTPLWSAPLFPVRRTMEEAVKATLDEEKSGEFLSLESSFQAADVSAILPWQEKLSDEVKAERFLEAIDDRRPADEAFEMFSGALPIRVKDKLHTTAQSGPLVRRMRIFYYISRFYEGNEREKLEGQCFDTLSKAIFDEAAKGLVYRDDFRIMRDEAEALLPVRVNWGGGWSDTPPHCNEQGGTVLNAAIKLDGRCPVRVTARRLSDRKIILASADSGSYEEFTELSTLQDCSNPHDSFALHKAALIACGVIPREGNVSLDKILGQLGGGIYLNTQVAGIPRGSGLGTSSILGGAAVQALFQFLGEKVSANEVFNRVLCIEQLMSTGGGWQDQVGGLVPGIKMVSSQPGINQQITCETVRISEDALLELNERLCLIYTGQRRLARNLLREIIGKYIGNDRDALFVLYEIQRMAVLMRFELEKGNINGFAELLTRHWELSKRLDQGCTNTCIDQIFLTIDDLIDGKMICGAGGGGFLQVILKRGISRQQLRDRLNEVFQDSGVDVWHCEIAR